MKQGSNQAIRFYVMESMKDWYRGGDPKKSVPKLVVGESPGWDLSCQVDRGVARRGGVSPSRNAIRF